MNGQQRAKAGGEVGANGEWYEGGKFIATQADRIKQAPVRHEVTPEEAARRAEAKAAQERTVARLQAWLAARAEQFAPVLTVLDRKLTDQWGNELPGQPQTFLQSLGQQLRESGSLSPRQAGFAVKAVFGRRNKGNGEQFDALLEALTQAFE